VVPVALAAPVVVLALAALAVLVLWSIVEALEAVEELHGENQRTMSHLTRAAVEEGPGSQSHLQAREVVLWSLLVARLPAAQETRR